MLGPQRSKYDYWNLPLGLLLILIIVGVHLHQRRPDSSLRASPEQPSRPRSGLSPERRPTGRLSDSSTRTDPGPYQHWTLLGPGSPHLQDTEQELSASSYSSYRW